MGRKRGLDGVVHRNTGPWVTPVYVALDIVKDVAIGIDRDEMDSDDRGTEWTGFMHGNKKADVELTITYLTTDVGYEELRDAFLNNTIIELAIMDDAIAQSGAEGLRAEFVISAWGREEPKDGEMVNKITLKPAAKAANTPVWLEIA